MKVQRALGSTMDDAISQTSFLDGTGTGTCIINSSAQNLFRARLQETIVRQMATLIEAAGKMEVQSEKAVGWPIRDTCGVIAMALGKYIKEKRDREAREQLGGASMS